MPLAPLLAATTTTLVNPAADAIQELKDPCGTDPSWACTFVYDRTGSKQWAGAADWLVAKPLAILTIVLVAWLANRIARWFIKRSIQRITAPGSKERARRLRTPSILLRTDEWNLRSEARAQTLIAVFRSLASAFIWFVAFVAVLEVLKINIGPLIAGAGIAGIALGFGTQTMVRDFIAGFFVVVEDQYGVGDVVDLGGDAKGTVERVTLRSTRLRDSAGVVWHVPNGQLVRVGNKSQEWARALLDVVVGYDADLERVKEVLHATAHGLTEDPRWSPEVLEEPDLWGVESLGADGITLRLVIKTRPASQFALLRELRLRLKAAFDEAGIGFAAAGGPTTVVLRDERVEPTSEPPLPPDADGAGPAAAHDDGPPGAHTGEGGADQARDRRGDAGAGGSAGSSSPGDDTAD